MKLIQFKYKIKSCSIRHRIDVIKIILDACEMINADLFFDYPSIKDLKTDHPFILIDEISRIFLSEDNKFFSISFPFQLNSSNKQVTFLNIPITSGMLSIINSVLTDFDERNSIVKLIDSLFENSGYSNMEKSEQQIIEELIRYLLSYEIGYIRYDFDPENYKKYSEIGKPKIHPINHLDINYSSHATYKLGLLQQIEIQDFLDCLNPTTNCWFINNE